MRRYMRTGGMLPLAFAVLLTLAAGLSLAEEHPWHHAEVTGATPWPAAASHSSGAQRHREGISVRHPVSAVGHSVAPATGVGSRALTGNELQDGLLEERP